MSSKESYNELDLVQKYYRGELSEAEKNALEQKAMDDPFLREAMDAYDEDPRALEEFSARHLKSKSNVGGTMLAAVLVLGALTTAVLLLNQNFDKEEIAEVPVVDSTEQVEMVEVDLIPVELETLEVAPEAEQITASDNIDNSVRYLEEYVADSVLVSENINLDEPIVIDEDDRRLDNIEFDITPETSENDFNAAQTTPATFMHDLLVVDYRQIERARKVEYTKRELSGLSAQYESDSTETWSEVTERVVEVSYVEYLDRTMYYMSRGKFKKALGRFNIILEQYPDDLNAIFYSGQAYFNLKQYEKALSLFEAGAAHKLNAFDQESLWYQAKSLIKLGRTNEAKNILDKIITSGGFYAPDAIRLRKSL